MPLSQWLVAVSAFALISLTPGAGAVNAMAMGLDHGVRRALWTVAGQQAALLLHLLVVAAGVGALVTSSPVAFEIVRWAGVAYLAYLGVSTWRRRPVTMDQAEHVAASVPPLRLFGRGLWVNLLNPKAIVFMLAVLPQLIRPADPLPPQWLVLVVTMLAIDVAVMTGFAALASRLRGFFRDAAGFAASTGSSARSSEWPPGCSPCPDGARVYRPPRLDTVTDTLPPCPECSSEFTYEMPPLLVCPECAHEWAPSEDGGRGDDDEAGTAREVHDSVGNVLSDGDTVVVAKDLKLKGTSGIKGGTKVKGIRLISPDEVVDGHDIDCKIDGIGRLQLKSSVVKKA